jgi:hypothetical protein
MSNQPLFMPYRMGDLDLPNRIVMAAPLTRMRAHPHDHVPTALQAKYYTQRASAGLIIAEATAISPQGFGWADTPGLWTKEQARGWRRVTDAVHAAGGRMIAQLWHTGAISHPELLDGAQPTRRLELLSEYVRCLDFRRCKKEFLSTGKERLGHFTIDVCGATFLIFESIKNSKGGWADLECEPGRGAGFFFDEGSCGLEERFYLKLFARPCL